MQLLIVRHAIAEERDDFALTGKPDDLRPLTNKGRNKMRKNVRGLLKLVPHINLIATSPLVRAMQTTEIVAKEYFNPPQETLPALAPRGAAQSVLAWLQQQPTHDLVALVGHEPELGELATWLLSGKPDTWLPMKKGGMCLLDFPDKIAPAEADLCWLLTPAQLRRIGG